MFPTVHVRRVDDRLVTGVADRQAEAYGFNSGLPWDRSEIYIRWLGAYPMAPHVVFVFYCS